MYFPQKYKGKTRDEIQQDIKNEGFNPIPINNAPGFVYHQHHHSETKLLVFLSGSMDVTTEGKTFHCIAGDKLLIPGNTPHAAVVGKEGCTFFWSEIVI